MCEDITIISDILFLFKAFYKKISVVSFFITFKDIYEIILEQLLMNDDVISKTLNLWINILNCLKKEQVYKGL